MLGSIFADAATGVTALEMVLCTAVSLVLGLVIAWVYMFRGAFSKNLALTIVIMPALVQSVITLVNGNLGTGLAVMGAFSLVRFRSAPGTAREITCIFFAMAVGLATGMGYLVYAVMLTAIVGVAMLALTLVKFGEAITAKRLKITIPEDLDYTGLFDDLFSAYTASHNLEQVKTTNLGSLYELHYTMTLKNPAQEKEFIDKIRCRNGNLNIVCGKMASNKEVL